jgi:hypothetical protein
MIDSKEMCVGKETERFQAKTKRYIDMTENRKDKETERDKGGVERRTKQILRDMDI